jgi:DNA polymerase beta
MNRPHRTTIEKIANPKNAHIIDEFKRLHIYLQNKMLKETDPQKLSILRFKISSTEKTIKILSKLTIRIKDSDDLKNIPGIGEGTRTRVQEILDDGKLSEIKGVTKKVVQNADVIMALQSVINIGESLARKLASNGVTSVEDLKIRIKRGEIKVNDKVMLGLKYFGTAEPIPREEVKKIRDLLIKELAKVNKKCEGQVCGSFRRGRHFSNDVDFLFVHPDVEKTEDSDLLQKFIEQLHKKGYIVDSLTDGNPTTKFMGFFRMNGKSKVRRIDIRFLPYRSLPAATLYFTGPGDFNQKMRQNAKRKGYILNEYGLYRKKGTELRRVVTNSEKDIFRILDMEWLTPKERDTAKI